MRLAFPGFSSWFQESATLVTSSPVLAAVATQTFSKLQLERALPSWERPVIQSVSTWLQTFWQEARYSDASIPVLLSPLQEQVVWERAIRAENPELFDAQATAQLAREAADRLVQYDIELDHAAWTEHADAAAFRRWLSQFQTECRRKGWIAVRDLWTLVPQWIAAGVCRPGPVRFVGFTSLFPALQRVRQLLPSSSVHRFDDLQQHPYVGFQKQEDAAAELELAARWARARLEADPDSSVAVFVPGLRSANTAVERAFRDVFYPRRSLEFQADEGASPYHINAASPLAEQPMIASALLVLELARPEFSQPDASAILRTPFIRGGLAEICERASADGTLRRFREFDINVRDLQTAARKCPVLADSLAQLKTVLSNAPRIADFPAWSEFMAGVLNAMGWPGDAELSAAEQELVETWKDALSQLAAMGLVSAPVPFDAALAALRRVLSGAQKQVGDWFSPVQILDASDAAGLHFDASFLLGLSESDWPPLERLSPLIPFALQRAAAVPGSTPASALQNQQQLTAGLLNSSSRLAGSYRELLSPSIERSCRVLPYDDSQWSGKRPVESYAPALLESIEERWAPPPPPGTRGDTGLIKSQSACAFRAFAEYRLNARPFDDACFGYDARQRGGFLHKAMQALWQEIGSQARLLALTDLQLEEAVVRAVDTAVNDPDRSEFHREITAVERDRLHDVLFEWVCKVEKERKVGFEVSETEKELNCVIAGLPMRMRMDRVDRLQGGGLALVDYKSGEQNKGKLDGDRPAEPQLLLYAAATGPEVEALFLGQMKPRCMTIAGVSRRTHWKTRKVIVEKDWDAAIHKYTETVTNLADAFMKGDALVDPRPDACTYCECKPLCRIQEQGETEAQDQE